MDGGLELGGCVNPGVAATTKREHVDKRVSFLSLVDGHGESKDEYGNMNWEKLGWKDVIANVKEIVDVNPKARSWSRLYWSSSSWARRDKQHDAGLLHQPAWFSWTALP